MLDVSVGEFWRLCVCGGGGVAIAYATIAYIVTVKIAILAFRLWRVGLDRAQPLTKGHGRGAQRWCSAGRNRPREGATRMEYSV